MKKTIKLRYHKKKRINISFEVFRESLDSKKTETKKEKTIIDKNYNKIFCIGFNKTATTSLAKTLDIFGFKMGNQNIAELLSEEVSKKMYEKFIKYCKTADAFQDIPFMFPEVYKVLDKTFPNSKFILTTRDNKEEWYDSLKRFHTKKFSKNKQSLPTEEDLVKTTYIYEGWVLDIKKMFWEYPKVPLYDKETYQNMYESHNKEVINYFKERSKDFIVLNLKQTQDFDKLCNFLNVKNPIITAFPWENKT